jgi:hypothetical protein
MCDCVLENSTTGREIWDCVHAQAIVCTVCLQDEQI